MDKKEQAPKNETRRHDVTHNEAGNPERVIETRFCFAMKLLSWMTIQQISKIAIAK